MKTVVIVAALLSMTLPGCQQPAAPETGDASEVSGTASQAREVDATVARVPPISAVSPPPATGAATFLGYGDMRLGSGATEARQAWGGELAGSESEPRGCHYLTPRWAASSGELGFMVEDDRFVRYDVGTARETAPGGGKVGMTAQELQALYGTLQSAPHKYLEGGRYFSIAAPEGGATRLVFETDAAGMVRSWRVGLPPQVDYVEGCS